MNFIDRAIGWINPEAGLRRAAARSQLDAITGQRADPSKNDRLSKAWFAKGNSGDSPFPKDAATIRERAWQLYEENPHAGKIVRILSAQVFGAGMVPKSTAVKNGKSWRELRVAAKKLWKAWTAKWDYDGTPAKGGFDYVGMVRQLSNELFVGGEAFVIIRRLTSKEQSDRGLPIPLAIEMLGAEWLVDDYLSPYGQKVVADNGNLIYRGIEYDAQWNRVAYHFRKLHAQDPRQITLKYDTTRIPASDVLHVYSKTRVKQQRGVSWFKPVLLRMRNVEDFDYNELVASATAAMPVFVASTERPLSSGQVRGLNSTTESEDTDSVGNRVTNVQAATMVNLKKGEKFEGFMSNRPNVNAEAFGTYSLRGISAGAPGMKASTLHGDYRGSSFASERSADNDVWRETYAVQQWMAGAVFQPLWSLMMEVGVMSGWFAEELDGRGFNASYFFANRDDLEYADWTGPVAKSINPLQDANARTAQMANGTLPYSEACAEEGSDWEENLKALEEISAAVDELDLEETIAAQLKLQLLGINGKPPDMLTELLTEEGLKMSPEEEMDKQAEMDADAAEKANEAKQTAQAGATNAA